MFRVQYNIVHMHEVFTIFSLCRKVQRLVILYIDSKNVTIYSYQQLWHHSNPTTNVDQLSADMERTPLAEAIATEHLAYW